MCHPFGKIRCRLRNLQNKNLMATMTVQVDVTRSKRCRDMSQDGSDSEMVGLGRQSKEENNIKRIMKQEKDMF